MLNKTIIDLNAIKDNALKIKSKLKSGVKFCAVVKADAYGHGAEMVASAIYNVVDCFAVALVEEGVNLRRAGIDKDILVLIPPFLEDIQLAVEYNLTISIDNEKMLEEVEKECERQNAVIKAHIKFNSGMNRLGVGLNELNKICKKFKGLKRVKLEGMFSHLACPENSELTKRAVDNFLLAKSTVLCYNKNAICHLSASGGLIKGYQFGMVRIGIMLYGYKPFKCGFINLKRAMKVYAPMLTNRVLTKGETFLYGDSLVGRKYKASLIRYGYADGGLRISGQGLIKNRCMDISAIESHKNFGKLVLVMDNAEKEAKARNTICYEVLCTASKRSERIYLN
ncbi:MAG: alanine racemase [Clostridia bacterium]|nr:alanine racemase [Clostridia bacterium]